MAVGRGKPGLREGTSATNEYAIFNNTAQAAIDKARKRVTELAVELGESCTRLCAISTLRPRFSSGCSTNLLPFIIKYRTAILGICTVFATYYTYIGVMKVAHAAYNVVVKTATAPAQRMAHSRGARTYSRYSLHSGNRRGHPRLPAPYRRDVG